MYFVTQGGRLIFRLSQAPGTLVSMKRKQEEPRRLDCAFASGESLDPAREELVFQAAEKAKDWDGFVFKLKLEGFEVEAGSGGTLKGPFGKL